MEIWDVPEKLKGCPRPIPKPRALLLNTDELEADFPGLRSKPKVVQKTVLFLKTAGMSTSMMMRDEAPEPEVGTSGKRLRQSREMMEPKQVKIVEKEKGKAPSKSLKEYVEVDNALVNEETHPNLLHEPLEEKVTLGARAGLPGQ